MCIPAGLTIDGLLEHLEVQTKTAIVEHNKRVLKQRDNKNITVENGDIIQIVKFIEGG